MNFSPLKSIQLWVSLLVVVAAFWVWNDRQERHQRAALEKQQMQTQRAASFLFRAFYADNFLTYSALSETTAQMGQEKMKSLARVVHAPHRLSITYVSGDMAGLHSGHNENWTWRRVSGSEAMIPYAELNRPTTEMAARSFTLLLKNYKARWKGSETLGAREVSVVELSPIRPAAGARGPARKLWIDNETGLTLRQRSFNYQMMPVMESVLRDVSFSPNIDASTFVAPQTLRLAAQKTPWVAHEAGHDRERVAQLSGLHPPEPAQLPPGFEFVGVGAHRCQTCEEECYAVLSRYSDGLNTLTVFAIQPACGRFMSKAAQLAEKDESQKSCDFGSGTLVMRDTEQANMIAVADLPTDALESVLESTTVKAYTPVSASSR